MRHGTRRQSHTPCLERAGTHTPDPGGRGLLEKQEMIHLLSTHPSIHLLIIYPSVHPSSMHLSVIYPLTHPSIHSPISCLSIHLSSVYPLIYPSVTHPFVYLYIYLFLACLRPLFGYIPGDLFWSQAGLNSS